ncbi:hypothetical protein I6E81_00130 [Salinibacterium sp. NG22]|uniref:hypothetical protein n=1 Tax=Salinibacterium sp. NG22 TaxID=2792040 RepID=UPI0018CD929C|nr:hypothetical protein [Salinibacterium sp. NG22]MBH0108570.1 hypothetical protein [Salinibacterium sp. NG22]
MTIFEQPHPAFLSTTRAGMCALWEPSRFTHVTDLDAWEDAFDNDESIIKMIKEGAFVPLNVGGGSTFKIDVRSGALTETEQRLRAVTSEPYLLKTEGLIQVGALEEIGSYMGGATEISVGKGNYSVTAHLIDWDAELGARDASGEASPDALPDFIVQLALIEPGSAPVFRTEVLTFPLPPPPAVKEIVVGDVFIVPTGDGRAGVGQVVGLYGTSSYYFAIFDAVLPLEVAAERAIEALMSPVLFLALSLDAKIYVGHWTVVTRTAVHAAVRLPAYKIGVGGPQNMHVEDYSGTRRRLATRAEINFLQYRSTVAPVRLEMALRAHLGLAPWHTEFDELKPDWVITTSAFFR